MLMIIPVCIISLPGTSVYTIIQGGAISYLILQGGATTDRILDRYHTKSKPYDPGIDIVAHGPIAP